MLQFSPWKQTGGRDKNIAFPTSLLLLCGGLANSLGLKIAERISDSSLKCSFDVEKTLYIETRKSDLAPLMHFPLFLFTAQRIQKNSTFTPALHIAVIKNV